MLPQGLPDTLLVATKGLYEALREEAEQKIKTMELESQQAQALLQQKISQQQQAIDTLIHQKKAVEDQMSLFKQQVATLQSNLESLQQSLEKKATDYELSQARLGDKTADNERLTEQLKHAQHNLEHYRESLRQQREEEKQRYEAHIAKLEQQSQQHQGTLAAAQQTLAVQQKQIEGLEQQQNRLVQEQHQLQQRNTEQALALQKQKIGHMALQEKHGKLAADYHVAHDALNNLQTNAHQWEVKFENAKGRIAALEQSLKKAEDNCVLLQDKNLQLMQEKTTLLAQLKPLKFKGT